MTYCFAPILRIFDNGFPPPQGSQPHNGLRSTRVSPLLIVPDTGPFVIDKIYSRL